MASRIDYVVCIASEEMPVLLRPVLHTTAGTAACSEVLARVGESTVPYNTGTEPPMQCLWRRRSRKGYMVHTDWATDRCGRHEGVSVQGFTAWRGLAWASRRSPLQAS